MQPICQNLSPRRECRFFQLYLTTKQTRSPHVLRVHALSARFAGDRLFPSHGSLGSPQPVGPCNAITQGLTYSPAHPLFLKPYERSSSIIRHLGGGHKHSIYIHIYIYICIYMHIIYRSDSQADSRQWTDSGRRTDGGRTTDGGKQADGGWTVDGRRTADGLVPTAFLCLFDVK